MRSIYKSLVVIFCLCSSSAMGQNLILEERTAENYGNYMDQVRAVESTLRNGKVNLNVEFSSKFMLSDTALLRLSNQFNKLIPKAFYNPDAFVIELDTKDYERKGKYYRWIYASIINKDIKTFGELIVTFDVDMKGEGVKYSKVLNIEVRAPKI